MFFLHVNFFSGMMYALIHFLRTPRATMVERRLWAYEYWLIFGFYAIFLLLAFFQESENKVIKINLPRVLARWRRRRHEPDTE